MTLCSATECYHLQMLPTYMNDDVPDGYQGFACLGPISVAPEPGEIAALLRSQPLSFLPILPLSDLSA
jgi:hypothetical protein